MNFLRLIRYKNLIMVLLIMVLVKYALIESAIPQPYLSDFEFVIFALSVLLITAGGYIINDIYDVQIDRINKPNKTYIGNSISKKKAWMLYVIFSFIGMSLGIYLSIAKNLYIHVFYYSIGFVCLYFYSRYFQKKILIGNIIIAFICGALIYLTYSFDFRFPKGYFHETPSTEVVKTLLRIFDIKFYIAFSFFGTLLREIIKDIEDINGDYNAGYKTLPIVLGIKRTRNIVIVLSMFFLLGLFLFASYYHLLSIYSNVISVGIMIVSLITVYFLRKLWYAKTKKHFHHLSNLMKLILFFGILSMILFTFV